MIWFTSDTHFGHERILDSTNRPLGSIREMNDALIANINEKVKPEDELYILGDYSFKMTAADAADLRRRIRCKKVHLVPGNHDRDWNQPAVAGTFIVEPHVCTLRQDKKKLALCHFPMADWPAMSHGSIHLHGHIHSEGHAYNEINRMQGLYRFDVGVDANGYSPVSLEEILNWFSGIECNGRAKWPNWVNATGSKQAARKLAGIKLGN